LKIGELPIASTDPASANPACVMASFATSWLGWTCHCLTDSALQAADAVLK
jgi:hypothetical protein